MNEDRRYIIRGIILLIGIIFLVKLFSIQVIDDKYKAAAQNNIIHKVIDYPFRGLIFDRNKKLLVHNDPIYDLMVIPKEAKLNDTLAFCELLDIDLEEFTGRMKKARRYSYIKPSVFEKQISNKQFAEIQDKLIHFKGFYPEARTVRGYDFSSLANVLGYIGEINSRQLSRDTTNYYKSGDYLGITGLESSYEQFLRGKRGIKYKMVNARGIDKGSFNNGEQDTLSIPGENLTLSIDIELQRYAERLLDGKVGSIVAIEPSSGEVLTFVSGPSYKPSLLAGKKFGKNYSMLTKDSLKPLFNRPLMAMYPPGSIFKTLQALIALQEGVITAKEKIYCDGTLIGDHAPPGYYDVHKGIMLSSNNYFHKVFRRVIERDPTKSPFVQGPEGLTHWRSMVNKFGLGQPLGVDLPNERSGLVPGVELYNRIYGKGRWKYSNISSMSIGQGEMLMNPIQMTNLAVIMANKGYYYRPHLVKSIGETGFILPEYQEKISCGIDAIHFPPVIEGMKDALGGTAPRAIIRDIEICGKTGTAQNPHGEDHSVFMAFAPKDNPKIAISVFVENAGWGGRAAACTASLIIEQYLRGEITRPWLEDYVLEGYFGD
ncbi:penicillin-binding transpeptidase domain-containing protein [Reichenbachiella versicolor]|uniref:penicillin-binding transpeptidase domain-containing protein n=1 Tax=Reichenbachiella versicolor TaxID=1821036 RepID=UPI000D6DE61A|nr:penicillin-binding transpeptidase domain-containing protein [Reichenbachiella versicolor]